jgi:hypothetical protein
MAPRLQSDLPMKHLAPILLVPAFICALASDGLGQESAPAPERKWYGGQTLLADGVSYAMLLGALTTQSEPLAYVGAGSYVVAPAVVHGIHHHGARAVMSVVMRLGFPLLGGGILYGISNCHKPKYEGDDEWCGFVPAMVGIGLGMAASTVVDASIAWDVPAQTAPTPHPTSSGHHSLVSFTTAGIVPTANGPRLMVGGRF